MSKRVISRLAILVIVLVLTAFVAVAEACVPQAQVNCVKNVGSFGGNIVAQLGASHSPVGSTGTISYHIEALNGLVLDGQPIAAGTIIGPQVLNQTFDPNATDNQPSLSVPYNSTAAGPVKVVIDKITIVNKYGKTVLDHKNPQDFAGSLSGCDNAAPPPVVPPAPPAAPPAAPPTPPAPPAAPPAAPPTPKVYKPNLTLKKVFTSMMTYIGTNIGSHIRVCNTGKGDAHNVAITDSPGSKLTIVSKDGGSMNNGHVIWSTGTLHAGECTDVNPMFRIDALGLTCNWASVSASNAKSAADHVCGTSKRKKSPPRSAGSTG